MKGSSSARLPTLNLCPLVASPYAQPKKNKNVKTKKEKEKNGKTPHMPDINCKRIERDLHGTENVSTGTTKGIKRKLKLTVFLPDDKEDNLEQKKMKQLEAYLRRKGRDCTYYTDNRLLRESSITIFRQSRQISAKSRDHLLSLMPTKAVPDNNYGNCISKDLVNSAKRELDMIKKHHENRQPSRGESGKLQALFKKSRKATRLKELLFGNRNKTNNSLLAVDHVIDSYSRRAYFLAPITVKSLPKTPTDSNKWKEGQEKIKTCYEHKNQRSHNEDTRSGANTPRTEQSKEKFDFYV